MRVLVTGFEPFAGAKLNPSQLVVEALEAVVGGHEIRTAVLPVTFADASAELSRLIADTQPEVVISLGQAEGRAQITIERVAVNLADASVADNAGIRLRDTAIADAGPAAYFTTLPFDAMLSAMIATGVPSAQSLSAGSFVCNHVFYSALHQLAGSRVRAGFIHLPLCDEQAADFPGLPTLALSEQIRGITAALGALTAP